MKKSLFVLFFVFFQTQAYEFDESFIQKQSENIHLLLKQQIDLYTQCDRKEIIQDMTKQLKMARSGAKEKGFSLNPSKANFITMASLEISSIKRLNKYKLKNKCFRTLKDLQNFTEFEFRENKYENIFAFSENARGAKLYYHEPLDTWGMMESIYFKRKIAVGTKT